MSTGGRTGGTWVSQLINFDRSYRLMFEPASREYLMVTRELLPMLRDNRLQYIRPFVDRSRTRAPCRRGDHGPLSSKDLTDQYNYTPRIVFKKRLIKETKSNLYAKWLHEALPRHAHLLLLVRHPILVDQLSRQPEYFDHALPPRANVRRRTKLRERTREYKALTLSQPELMQDFLEPFRAVIESATSVFAQRMVVWCIQNYVPLHQVRPRRSPSRVLRKLLHRTRQRDAPSAPSFSAPNCVTMKSIASCGPQPEAHRRRCTARQSARLSRAVGDRGLRADREMDEARPAR